jgi:AcrR family transcriptional regulator
MKISEAPFQDSDLWEQLPAGPRRLLAQAAAYEFGRRGYHATTTRDIAVHAGMSPAGLYAHYASKAELLFIISRIGHQSVLQQTMAAADDIPDGPARLHAIVRAFTMWHAKHHTLARVLQYEIRSLEPDHFQIIADIRRQTEGFIADTLEQVTNDPKLLRVQTAAILSLGIDTARWFSATKPISADELADGYAELVLRMAHVSMPFVKA